MYIFSFILLLVFVATSTKDNYFHQGDERAHRSNLEILQKNGIGKTYLHQYYGMAGPLYPVIQHLLLPVTREKASRMRLVNISFLFIFLLLAFYGLGDRSVNPWYVMALPMTIVCSGYALTIMPSLVFLLCAILLLTKYGEQRNPKFSHFSLFLSGILLALAVLMRLNLLILIVPFLGWIWLRDKEESRWMRVLELIGFLLGLVPLLLFTFIAWEGLIPTQAKLSFLESNRAWLQSYSITHGLLNLAFMASIFFLLTPHWYIRKIITMRVWLGIAILLFVLNYFTNLFNYVPALSFFEKFELPNYLFHLIGIFFGSVTIILCLIFLVNFYYRLRENRTNRLYIFSAVGLFLLAATIFKVDYIFSSRYALQALPFVMIMGAYYGSDKQWAHLIRYAGILIGFVMYFSFRNI